MTAEFRETARMEARHTLFELLRSLERPFANVVQVGANRGQELAAFEAYGVDWGIMIEPLDLPFHKLRKWSRGRPRYIPVQALCSSQEGIEYDFFVATNVGASSSILPPTRHLIEHPEVEFPTTIKLVSTTVDAIVAQVLASHPELQVGQLDTLMIDVQGAELKVLMGSTSLLQHVRQIFTEVSYNLYDGGASLEDLQGFLKAFGFELAAFEQNRHRWGDALFVKWGA